MNELKSFAADAFIFGIGFAFAVTVVFGLLFKLKETLLNRHIKKSQHRSHVS